MTDQPPAAPKTPSRAPETGAHEPADDPDLDIFAQPVPHSIRVLIARLKAAEGKRCQSSKG